MVNLAYRGTIFVLGGAGADCGGAGVSGRLHTEEIVARAAAGIARHDLAPVGLECRLGDQVARIDAELLPGLLRRRQDFADEVGALRRGRNRHTRRPSCGRGVRPACGARRCRSLRTLGDEAAALQLLHEHVRKAKSAAAGNLHRQLVIEHALIEVLLIAAQELVAEIRIAHALDHHARENGFELPCGLAQRLRILILRAAFERIEPGEAPARVIVNSRTGTVVISSHVRVMPAAVAHGSLSVTITERQDVSQPNAFSNGETVVTPRTAFDVQQGESRMFVFRAGVNLDEIVRAVNQVGAAPGDLVAILEALKEAGALRAELIVI